MRLSIILPMIAIVTIVGLTIVVDEIRHATPERVATEMEDLIPGILSEDPRNEVISGQGLPRIVFMMRDADFQPPWIEKKGIVPIIRMAVKRKYMEQLDGWGQEERKLREGIWWRYLHGIYRVLRKYRPGETWLYPDEYEFRPDPRNPSRLFLDFQLELRQRQPVDSKRKKE